MPHFSDRNLKINSSLINQINFFSVVWSLISVLCYFVSSNLLSCLPFRSSSVAAWILLCQKQAEARFRLSASSHKIDQKWHKNLYKYFLNNGRYAMKYIMGGKFWKLYIHFKRIQINSIAFFFTQKILYIISINDRETLCYPDNIFEFPLLYQLSFGLKPCSPEVCITSS